MKFWKIKYDTMQGFGLAPIFALINSRYVITVRIFSFRFCYDKELKWFFRQ